MGSTYNDERLTDVKNDEKVALNEVEKTYGGMISNSDKYYQDQIDASNKWAETQRKNQQEQTDFAIQEINQQKAQAEKDYQKEQRGAYADYQKGVNPYGPNAEQMAAAGLNNSGYAESSQVAMYVAYQNRVATARESYQLAVQNYNNAITEARLQNNSILAEIAYTALQQQLELSLQGFQYKNSLIIEKANQKRDVQNMYHGQYMDVLQQINQENALAEQKTSTNRKSSTEQKSSINKGAKNETIKNTQSKNKSNELEVDMSSVLALGYGPISDKRLDQLIREGKVKEVVKNGKLTFVRAFNYK